MIYYSRVNNNTGPESAKLLRPLLVNEPNLQAGVEHIVQASSRDPVLLQALGASKISR